MDIKRKISKFLTKKQEAIGVIEIILILVIIIGLIIIFREQIKQLVDSAFETISSKSGDIISE